MAVYGEQPGLTLMRWNDDLEYVLRNSAELVEERTPLNGETAVCRGCRCTIENYINTWRLCEDCWVVVKRVWVLTKT